MWLKIAALACTGLAVICAIVAANITVADNLDTFIGDLSRKGRWTMYAATFSGLALIVQVADLIVLKCPRKG